MGKQMEGDSRQRRKTAREAREAGKRPSDVGGSLGASKQRSEAETGMTHQQRVDLVREGKHEVTSAHTPRARPGSRDAETPDREKHPRLERK